MNGRLAIIASGLLLATACTPAEPPRAAEPTRPTTASAPVVVSSKPAGESKPELPKPQVVATAIAAPPAQKPAEQPKPAANPAANPREELTSAFRGWGTTKSFRAKITTTGIPGIEQSEMKIEVAMPDRFHSDNGRMEMIKVGQDLFVKLPTGWQKISQNMDIDLANPKKFEAEIGAQTDVRLVGADVFEGTPCKVYEYTSTLGAAGQTAPPQNVNPAVAKALAKAEANAPSKPQSYTAKVWIAVADNLPRKAESKDPSSDVKSTIVYYDFNAPITINPPI
ncbi:MAG: hypothetical protein U0821_23700 [Chloroflexota bacterium]